MIQLITRCSLVVLSLTAMAPSQVFAAPDDAAPTGRVRSIEEELKLKAGDESGNEIKALKTELLVMRSEKQALAQLEKLRVRYKGTRMEAEILFRLGEIYMRRARTERFFEIHRDSNQVVRFAPDMVKQASEVAQIRKAIGIYLGLDAKFPRFRALDIVTFNTAYAYQQVGDDKKAEEQFRRLLAKYPNSSLVPDTLLSLGEIQFSRRQFAAALELFLKIKEHPQARVYPYGLYKAAWSKYNLQDENGGMKLLEEVVAYGHVRAVAGANVAKLDLRKEALGDLALFFSEARKPDQAVEYFISQSGDLDPVPYILRLVDIYERHSKYAEVDVVLRGVLSKAPKSAQISQVHEKLIWNADKQKRRDVTVNQLAALESSCAELPDKTPEETPGKTPPRTECLQKVIEVSKKLGAKLHAYWKRDKSAETADFALRAYETYLRNAVVVGHESAQVRYATADLMFARARFRDASANYALVNVDSIQSPGKSTGKSTEKSKNLVRPAFDLMKTDPKLAVDAAYGAVLSLEKAVGDSKWTDSDETMFRQLADQYLVRAPQGPYALDLRFKRAFIAYEKENYDIAAVGFKEIGWAKYTSEAVASSEKVLKAQDLYLDILNIKKDYKNLKDAAQTLLSRASATAVLPKAREDQLSKIRREAWFAEVAEIEQKGDADKAVGMYKSFALENRGTELAPRAWWNASQLLFKNGKTSAGAAMCSEMNDLFPGAVNAKECLTQAAQTFEAMARLDLAAKAVMSLSEIDVAKRTYWREIASDFFALSGTRDGKERAIQMFLKSAEDKKPEQKLALFEKSIQIAKELRDQKTASSLRQKIESLGLEPAASRFIVEEAEAAYKAGDATRAFNLVKRVVGRESVLKNAKDIPARARFLQARILDDEYRAQSVKARVERIGIVLALKTEKLEKAQKAYQSSARMGDNAVAVESLGRLAELYIDYSNTVKGMKLPSDVPESDQQAFAKEIESIVLPMEEKGIEALSQAIDAARKSGRLDGYAGVLQERLDKLNLKSEVSTRVEVDELPRMVPAFSWKILGWIEKGGLR